MWRCATFISMAHSDCRPPWGTWCQITPRSLATWELGLMRAAITAAHAAGVRSEARNSRTTTLRMRNEATALIVDESSRKAKEAGLQWLLPGRSRLLGWMVMVSVGMSGRRCCCISELGTLKRCTWDIGKEKEKNIRVRP